MIFIYLSRSTRFGAAIRLIREKKGREKRVISKMPVHGSLYRFGKRPIGKKSQAPVTVCDVEGGAICSKNSTFGYFDGTAWTPRLRSPTPIMAPGC